MTVSIHWASRPGLSHTLVISRAGNNIGATVRTYDGEDADEHRCIEGLLSTIVPMIMRSPRYEFTRGLLARARYNPNESRDLYEALVRIVNPMGVPA